MLVKELRRSKSILRQKWLVAAKLTTTLTSQEMMIVFVSTYLHINNITVENIFQKVKEVYLQVPVT